MKIILVVIIALFTFSCDTLVISNSKQIDKITKLIAESAYYEGQKDAIECDIRIEKNSCGDYNWVKSPWDGKRLGDSYVYNPKLSIKENIKLTLSN